MFDISADWPKNKILYPLNLGTVAANKMLTFRFRSTIVTVQKCFRFHTVLRKPLKRVNTHTRSRNRLVGRRGRNAIIISLPRAAN